MIIIESHNNIIEIIIGYELGDSRLVVSVIPSTTVNYDDLSPQEQADYDSFIITIEGLLKSDGCSLIKSDRSPKSGISHYFMFYSKTGTKWFIILRVSNHSLGGIPNETDPKKLKASKLDAENRAKKHYADVANQFKRSSAKNQKWKLRSVIVNNEEFNSYDEALDKIDEILERL